MPFECIAPPAGKLLPFILVMYRDGQRTVSSEALSSEQQIDEFFNRAELSGEATDEPRERAKQLLAEQVAARGWQADDPEPALQDEQRDDE